MLLTSTSGSHASKHMFSTLTSRNSPANKPSMGIYKTRPGGAALPDAAKGTQADRQAHEIGNIGIKPTLESQETTADSKLNNSLRVHLI